MIETLEKKLSKKQMKQKDRYKIFVFAMIDKEISQAFIAKELGVTPTMILYVMWGQRKSKRLEKKICEILGVDIKEVA